MRTNLSSTEITSRDNRFECVRHRIKSSSLTIDELNYYLELFLAEAQHLFGPKLNPYPRRFIGISFGNGTRPTTRRKRDRDGTDTVEIVLSKYCRRDLQTALWSLCHESVHLLSPSEADNTILEEGLACWHERWWVSNCPEAFPDKFLRPDFEYAIKKYNRALKLASSLMSQDATSIKRIREIEPVIGKISADLILQLVPNLPTTLAHSLVSPWSKKLPTRTSSDESGVGSCPTIFDLNAEESTVQCDRCLIETINAKKRGVMSQTYQLHLEDKTKLLLHALTKSQTYYKNGQIFFNAWNSSGELLRTFETTAECGPGAWSRYDACFDLPAGKAVIEIGAHLKHIGSMQIEYLGLKLSPDTLSYSHHALPIPSGPTNLNLQYPLDSNSESNWVAWFGTSNVCGSYGQYSVVRIDPKIKFAKRNAIQLKTPGLEANHNSFCAVLQTFSAASFQNKQVQFTGFWKSKNIEFCGEIFLEADQKGSSNRQTVVVQNGSKNWTEFILEMQISSDANTVTLGAKLFDKGLLWISNLCFICRTR